MSGLGQGELYINGVEVGTVEDFQVFAKGVNETMTKHINEIMTEDTVKPTQQELFDRYVNLYHEQATIGLDIKALSEEFKEFYPDEDLTTIKQVAKSKAEESLGSKIDKADKFKEVAEIFVK